MKGLNISAGFLTPEQLRFLPAASSQRFKSCTDSRAATHSFTGMTSSMRAVRTLSCAGSLSVKESRLLHRNVFVGFRRGSENPIMPAGLLLTTI